MSGLVDSPSGGKLMEAEGGVVIEIFGGAEDEARSLDAARQARERQAEAEAKAASDEAIVGGSAPGGVPTTTAPPAPAAGDAPAKPVDSPTPAGGGLHWGWYVAGALAVGAAARGSNHSSSSDGDTVAPQIVGPGNATGDYASLTVNEQTAAVYRFAADENVSWSISGGVDAGLFDIAGDGQLRFKTAPDYEIPGDQDGDNRYEVQVGARDAAGNLRRQTVQVTVAADGAPADATAPTVSVRTDAGNSAGGPFIVYIDFSEPVSGFDLGDIALSAGAKGDFAGTGASYTLSVTPPADAAGTVGLTLAAGVARDAAGNSSLAGGVSQAYDTRVQTALGPDLTITDNVAGVTTGAFAFLFSFSEAVTGFTSADLSLDAGVKGAFSGSGAEYSLLVTPPADAEGSVGVSVAAGAATGVSGGSSRGASASKVYDTASPVVYITDDAPGIATGDVTFSFAPSEPLTGFAAGDIRLGGGSAGVFDGSRLVVTPPVDAEGTLTLDIPFGAFTDAAGNRNPATGVSQQYDTRPPTVTIADDEAGVAIGAVTFTITFSEPVTGFDAGHISVSGGSKGALTGAGKEYRITVTPARNESGTMVVEVPGVAAIDAAGNGNVAATANRQEFDTRYTPGVTEVIDLGTYGKLIAPVKVDGENWYYYWDRSGDGTSAGADYTNHDVLDALFTEDAGGVAGTAGDTDGTFRYTTLNGVRVALPIAGGEVVIFDAGRSFSGTTVDNVPAGEANPTYDGLLAIWDAHNGAATGTRLEGVPSGWYSSISTTYWSASSTPYSGATAHLSLAFGSGALYPDPDSEFLFHYVALQVL